MADPINQTAAVSSLIRAQQLQQIQAPVVALKNNQTTSQAIQLQRTAAPAKASAVTLTSHAVGPNANLPRGSIVDRLV